MIPDMQYSSQLLTTVLHVRNHSNILEQVNEMKFLSSQIIHILLPQN